MIDQNIVKSIFKSHSINKVVYIDEGSFNSFIIYEMSNSISVDKWNNLEHLLQDITKKKLLYYLMLKQLSTLEKTI